MSLIDTRNSNTISSSADDNAPSTTYSVLIVEDDPADFYALRRLLRRSNGITFEITHVETVPEAVEILATRQVDVAIIDYFIGGRLGTEILDELGDRNSIPALMVTGKDFSRRDRERVHGGRFDFLDKNELTRTALLRSIHFTINRVRIENNLCRTEKRLRTVRAEARELRCAREQADRANKVKSDLLACMGDELRPPLNAILGYSEVIRDDLFATGANPRYSDYADAIHVSGQHLLSLVNDLLDLSKIEAGSRALEIEDIDISHALDEVMTLLAPVAEKCKITIDRDLQPGMRAVRADMRALKQMLVNLVSNAIKFSPEGGSILLKMHETAGESVITIVDTGIGIPEHEIAVAFNPFCQTVGANLTNTKGTGLGLPISRLLIEEHGGTLTLSSTLGIGTSVTLRFPKASEDRVGYGKLRAVEQVSC